MAIDVGRDEFLRGVIEELQPSNERWPGLWTRLADLMAERDRLREALDAAEERLGTIYASRNPERMTQEAYFGLQELEKFHMRPERTEEA